MTSRQQKHRQRLDQIYRLYVWLGQARYRVMFVFGIFFLLAFLALMIGDFRRGDTIPATDIVAVVVLCSIAGPAFYLLLRFVIGGTLALNSYDPDSRDGS